MIPINEQSTFFKNFIELCHLLCLKIALIKRDPFEERFYQLILHLNLSKEFSRKSVWMVNL